MKKAIILFLAVEFLFSCDTNENKVESSKLKMIANSKENLDSLNKNHSTSSFWDTVITIYFENKNLTISPKDLARIKNLSQIHASDTLRSMKVIGFTDTSGTEKANDILSEKRANKVYNLLGSQIKKEVVYVSWLGESADVYDLHFHPVHPQQNCVDIFILTKVTNH